MASPSNDLIHGGGERFRLLAEHAQDVIFRYRVAPSRGFEYVNPAVAALTGYTPDEHYADPDLGFKLVHPDDREKLESMLGAESPGGLLTVRWIRRDGAVVWTEQHNVPIRDHEGQLVAIEGIARDVTERKRTEGALRSLQDEFISSISHDLRTPLAAIKASVGVVLANEPPGISEPLRRMLVNIDGAADDLSEMVSNVLELARFQAHEGELRRAWYDLRAISKRAIDAIEPMAKRKGQRFEARLPSGPLWAYCDGTRIERALCNLLGNARKYSGADTTVSVVLARRGREAIISVTDQGPGIAPADRDGIFERSYGRADGKPGRGVGTGLGLPIAHAIAVMHDGRLWLDSPPGEGATFRLALPLAPVTPVESGVPVRD
jgi:PAS domain S-box-containing protein